LLLPQSLLKFHHEHRFFKFTKTLSKVYWPLNDMWVWDFNLYRQQIGSNTFETQKLINQKLRIISVFIGESYFHFYGMWRWIFSFLIFLRTENPFIIFLFLRKLLVKSVISIKKGINLKSTLSIYSFFQSQIQFICFDQNPIFHN
jgi:hypothetical protein